MEIIINLLLLYLFAAADAIFVVDDKLIEES